MRKVTITELRKDIYTIVDHILKTGDPVEITRRGDTLKIIPSKKVKQFSRLQRLKPIKDLIIGDPEDLANIDWSDY